MDIKLGNEINIGWNSQDARALDPKYFNLNILNIIAKITCIFKQMSC